MDLVKMTLSQPAKQALLVAVTSLVVAYVRHGISSNWAPWDSIGQFLGYWLIHWLGLVLFFGITFVAIWRTYRIFLGSDSREATYDELLFYICMAVLVAAIGFFVAAHWVPTSDDLNETELSL